MTGYKPYAFLLAILLAGVGAGSVGAADAPAPLPFRPGETIRYDIKKLKMRVGQASLTFHGLVSMEGQSALLITFTSKGLKFFDEEKIYVDPRTFLPRLVERNLNIFGKKRKSSNITMPEKERCALSRPPGEKRPNRSSNVPFHWTTSTVLFSVTG